MVSQIFFGPNVRQDDFHTSIHKHHRIENCFSQPPYFAPESVLSLGSRARSSAMSRSRSVFFTYHRGQQMRARADGTREPDACIRGGPFESVPASRSRSRSKAEL